MDQNLRFRRALLHRFLQIAGISAATMSAFGGAACGGQAVVESGDGTGGAGGAGSTTNSTTSTDVATSSGISTSATTNATTAVSTSAVTSSSTGQTTHLKCVPAAADGSCPSGAEALPYVQQFDCTDPDYEWTTSIVDGPWQDENGQCCYEVTTDFCGVGRPLRIAGAPVTAPLKVSADSRETRWIEAISDICVDSLSDVDRDNLARAWEQDGLLEHASVASFARFSIELMSFGAPADLVALAHEAALDEIRHARACFALASAYRGTPVAPTALPVPSALTLATSLAALARAAVEEGVIGETLASLMAAEEASLTEDPVVRGVLEGIASDEARHAELAVRAVVWAMKTGGTEVRAAVTEAFAAVMYGAVKIPMVAGRMGREALTRVAKRGIADVLAPCAEALLGVPSTTRERGQGAALA